MLFTFIPLLILYPLLAYMINILKYKLLKELFVLGIIDVYEDYPDASMKSGFVTKHCKQRVPLTKTSVLFYYLLKRHWCK